VKLALTCLIALTAPPTTTTTANPVDTSIEELEEKANEPLVKLMLVNKVLDRVIDSLILNYNKVQTVTESKQRKSIDYTMELLSILLANVTTVEQGVGRLLQLKTFRDAMDEIKNLNDDEDVEEESDDDSDDEDWAQGYFFKKLTEMFLSQPPISNPWEVDNGLKYTRWLANVFTNISTVCIFSHVSQIVYSHSLLGCYW
jgi:hypothetical protein